MSALKWKTDPSGAERLTVGDMFSFVVESGADWADGLGRLRAEVERNPRYLHNSSEAAKKVAEQTACMMYEDLREHLAPVLRWTLECNGCLSEGLFVCEENSPLRAWRLAAMHYGHDVSFRGNGRHGRAEVDTIEANQSAAETELRALGVRFRVERNEQNGGAK